MKFYLWLLGQVIVAALAIAVDMLRPSPNVKPIVVHYPLRVTSKRDLARFSTAITMTPGTLSLGFRDGILDVHAVYGQDPAEVLAGLADMEEHVNPAIKDVDRGAPGQGLGDPSHSTFVAGHSDQNYGPTEVFE